MSNKLDFTALTLAYKIYGAQKKSLHNKRSCKTPRTPAERLYAVMFDIILSGKPNVIKALCKQIQTLANENKLHKQNWQSVQYCLISILQKHTEHAFTDLDYKTLINDNNILEYPKLLQTQIKSKINLLKHWVKQQNHIVQVSEVIKYLQHQKYYHPYKKDYTGIRNHKLLKPYFDKYND